MEEIASILMENDLSIASIESFTVGSFASLIGSIPGISKVYKGSMVTYQTETKHRILGIDNSIIDKFGVVSREVAQEMAVLGRQMFDSDICVSFTGNSGPLPMENKPVGICYVGICFRKETYIYTLHLDGTREEIKQQAIDRAVIILKKILKEWRIKNGSKSK